MHRHWIIEPGRTSPPGFTLVEVLLAISILGVGLVLAAALFPTALMHNRTSAANTVGTLICENALTVVRNRVTDSAYKAAYTDPNDPSELFKMHELNPGTLVRGQLLLGQYDLVYPLPTFPIPAATDINANPKNFPDWTVVSSNAVPRSRYGAAVLARRTANCNNYQFVIAAYRVIDPVNKCRWSAIKGTVDGSSDLTLTAGNIADIQVNAPVVLQDGSGYAFIKKIAGGKLTLDRVIPSGDMYVLTQMDAGNTILRNTFSPVLHVMNVQAALR